MQIYVACLAAYNNGKLHGVWIDVTKGKEHIQEEIKKVLATSPENNQPYPCEEWAVHDYEGLPSSLGEYPGLDKICEIADFIEEHGEIAGEVLDHFCGDVDDARSAIEDHFVGEYKDAEDFAVQWVEMCGDKIPESVSYYIDYERMGNDMLMDGFYSIEVGDSIHVFTH